MASTTYNEFTNIPIAYSGVNNNSYTWQTAYCCKEHFKSSDQTILSPSVSQSNFIKNSSYITTSGIITITLEMINIGTQSGISCVNGFPYIYSIKDFAKVNGFSSSKNQVKFCPGSYGINLSNPASSEGMCLALYKQLVDYGASFIPGVDLVESSLTLENSLHEDFFGTCHTSSSSEDGTASETFLVNNSTHTIGCSQQDFQNNFLSVAEVQVTLLTSSFYDSTNTSSITIGSQTSIGSSVAYPPNNILANGASSSKSINLKPAVSICGYVYNNGSPYKNGNVCLVQTYNGVSVGFQLKTNSDGLWQFYAEPGATYELTGQNLSDIGESSSWGYSVLDILSSDTSVSMEGSDIEVPSGGSNFELNVTNLNGVFTANGDPVENAGVCVMINSQIISIGTNSNGAFSIIIPMNSYVSVGISADCPYTVQSANVGTNPSYTMKFSYTSSPFSGGGGGGGGGCVLYGTNITLANGSTVQVQNLYAGEKILSYNTNKDRFFTDKVKQIIITRNVTSIIRIDSFISLSGPTVQPVYVQTANGTNEWIFLGQITVGMSLYNPLNNTWVKVTNINIVIGSFTVYEVIGSKEFWDQGHKRTDYIANGILVDRKAYI